jgi:microcystin-dependent protein
VAYTAPSAVNAGDALTASLYNTYVKDNIIDLNARACPVASVMSYAGTSAPTGWLLCAGQAVSQSTYADLYAAVGANAYGTDSGGNFSLPDLRGRVAAGKDNMGGSTASRLTAAGSGITGTTLGANGGTQTHALSTAQLAAHTHTIQEVARFIPGNSGAGAMNNIENVAATSRNTGSEGSGTAHQNTQPTIILNYIIKT